jgi:hypothetical protein
MPSCDEIACAPITPAVGVGDRRRHPLELAVLLRQLVRGAHERVRQLFLQDRLDALLVSRIAVGVEEQHRDRLDALAAQLARQLAHRGLVERLVRAAVGAQPLGHLEAQRALHERRVLVEEQVVRVRPVDAADLVDVAEALGDEERRPGPVALEQRVDRDRRAVQEQVAVAPVDLRAVDRVLDAVDELAVGRERLAEQEAAARLVERGHVGERAADVDGDAKLRAGARSRSRGLCHGVSGRHAAVPMRFLRIPRPVISTSTTSPSFM